MIYHVNERKKEQALNLYFALLIPPLLSFYWGLAIAGPIPTNLNKFSSIVTGNLCPFQVFDDVCSQFDVDLASDLAPLEGTENPRKQPNCKSLIKKTRNYSTTTRNYCYIYLHTCRIFRRWNKNTNSSVSSPRGKKIPKPSFAGLPTIKLKQSYYHVYVDL